MKKRIARMIALGLTITMVLSGCANSPYNEDTLRKIENIGNNVTKISENFTEEATAKLSEDIESASDAANELAEAASEIGEAPIEEVAEEEAEVGTIEAVGINDGDILDSIKAAILEELIKYGQKGEELLAQALKRKDAGLATMKKGLDKFIATFQKASDNTLVANVIDDSFDSAKMVVDGANEVASGATLILTQTTKWTEELLDMASVVGIESKELDEARAIVEEAQNINIEFVPESNVAQMDLYREYLKSNIPGQLTVGDAKKSTQGKVEQGIDKASEYVVDIDIEVDPDDYLAVALKQANAIVDRANEALEMADDMYVVAEEAAQGLIDEAKKRGIDENKIKEIKEMLSIYEKMAEETFGVTQKDIDNVEKQIEDAINSIDLQDVLKVIE